MLMRAFGRLVQELDREMNRNTKGFIYHASHNNIKVKPLLLLLLSVAIVCFLLGIFFERSEQTTTVEPPHGNKMVFGRFGHRQAEFAPFTQK